uniref:DNA ligase domain protein n=1 Tax=viral metagenome TaxID=1070528 RepID=A0A6C0K2J7_9ZZZZ
MQNILCLRDARINPLLSSYQHLLREDNYFKCLPLIIASLPSAEEQQKALEQSLHRDLLQRYAQSWPEICQKLISMLSSPKTREEKTALFLSLQNPPLVPKSIQILGKNLSALTMDPEQEIPITLWNPATGVMKYKQLRPREVETNPTLYLRPYIGYYVSRKYDGWQMTWNGATRKLTSHTGKIVFDAPEWWTRFLPAQYTIAGELIIPGKQAAKVSSLRKKTCPDWATALFMAFDILGTVSVPFEKRTKKLQQIVERSCGQDPTCPFRYVEQVKMKSVENIWEYFKKITYDQGGQGIVITRPGSFYVPGGSRSNERLKLKKREDTEGIVIGYNEDGMRLTSLLVRMVTNRAVFNLGVGFTDKERHDYKKEFPIGSLIKFSYRELTDEGKPKEARFVQHRLDK